MGDFAHERKQPQIMLVLEFGLVCMIGKSVNVGTSITKSSIKEMGSDLYLELRALPIYDDAGERLRLLSDLSEVYHVEEAAKTGESTPGKPRHEFFPSDDWLKGFVSRSNINNVIRMTTDAEIGRPYYFEAPLPQMLLFMEIGLEKSGRYIQCVHSQ